MNKSLSFFYHSYLADQYHFDPQMQTLEDRYGCIAYDHRGHGQSEIANEGYDRENLYKDAVEGKYFAAVLTEFMKWDRTNT